MEPMITFGSVTLDSGRKAFIRLSSIDAIFDTSLNQGAPRARVLLGGTWCDLQESYWDLVHAVSHLNKLTPADIPASAFAALEEKEKES